MVVFSWQPWLEKRHCHWNKDFNGLHSQEKQGMQAHSPLTSLSPLCAEYLVLGHGAFGVCVAHVG